VFHSALLSPEAETCDIFIVRLLNDSKRCLDELKSRREALAKEDIVADSDLKLLRVCFATNGRTFPSLGLSDPVVQASQYWKRGARPKDIWTASNIFWRRSSAKSIRQR
jgi:hypothetical protein